MLAYTTVSDILHLPTVLEIAVYLGGLLLLLALPTAYFLLTSARDGEA